VNNDLHDVRPSRRRWLRTAGGAGLVAAAVAAETIARPAAAQAGTDGDVVLGASNEETSATLISLTLPGGTAFIAEASGTGSIGVLATSDIGTAVMGNATPVRGGGGTGVAGAASGGGTGVSGTVTGGGTGVAGSSDYGIGVTGSSTSYWGVWATSTNNTALQAGSDKGTGVVGTSTSAAGVYGQSGSADGFALTRDGVRGYTDSATAAGVRGQNVGGGPGVSGGGYVGVQAQAIGIGATALDVHGPAVFSRSGVLTIPAGASAATQTGVHLTAASLVLATLQHNVAGVHVQAAVPKVSANSSFTIHLNTTVTVAVKVAWFVVN